MAPSIGVTTEKPVVFSVTMRSEKDGPYQYAWDFGDGGASSSKEPGYRYPKPGTYAVSVTVSNKAGQDQKTATINVAAPDSDLYFWTQTPVNGQIQVTIGGITRFITLYHTQFPGCARGSGMAEFTDLPYGTYDYSAVSQSGKTWSGRVTLQEHCRNIPLN
jgi:PKD repeat protein